MHTQYLLPQQTALKFESASARLHFPFRPHYPCPTALPLAFTAELHVAARRDDLTLPALSTLLASATPPAKNGKLVTHKGPGRQWYAGDEFPRLRDQLLEARPGCFAKRRQRVQTVCVCVCVCVCLGVCVFRCVLGASPATTIAVIGAQVCVCLGVC